MPLSEHEQRLLDQIERALYQEDPKFASTVRQSDLRTHMRRRVRRAAIVLALGFALLLAGVLKGQPGIGVVGFVVMVGALVLAMASWKRLQPASTLHVAGEPPRGDRAKPGRRGRPSRGGGQSGGDGFKGRLEDRWKRRWDERGGEGR